MAILKRIFLHICRKPIKSILFVFSIFSISSILGSSYLVYNSTKQLNDELKSKIESYAVIRYSDDYMANLTSQNEIEYKENQDEIFHIFSKLSDHNNVISSNINISENSFGVFVADLINKHLVIYDEKAIGTLYLCGIEANSMLESQSIIEITEGRSFTKEDINNNRKVILIRDDYSYDDGNKVMIGDKINIKYQNYEEYADINGEPIYIDYNSIDYEFTVIGKYKTNMSNVSKVWDEINSFNTYLPITTFNKIIDEIHQSDTLKKVKNNFKIFEYNNMIFRLDNPESINDFVNFYNILAEKNKNIELLTSMDGYNEIKGILENISDISKIIIMAAIIFSSIILFLVTFMYLIDQKKNIAIFASLGEKKRYILLQFIIELLILGTIGFQISTYSNRIISKKIYNTILETKIDDLNIQDINNKIDYNQELKDYFYMDSNDLYYKYIFIGECSLLIIVTVLSTNKLLKSNLKNTLL